MKSKAAHIATYSGVLAATEMGLGAWVHALHLPLGGQVLSLNQGFLLSLASRGQTRALGASVSYGVSSVSALLKSLSPMGKRLTPMLAIWMQGVLFSCGTLLGGTGLVGITLSNLLMSLWSFVQPALLAVLVFGVDPLAEWVKLFPNAIGVLGWVILAAVIIKMLLAIVLGILAIRISETGLKKYLSLAKHAIDTGVEKNKLGQIIWIVGSGVIGLALFFIHGESTIQSFISYVLRPLAVCLILFYGMGLVFYLPILGPALARAKRDFSSNS